MADKYAEDKNKMNGIEDYARLINGNIGSKLVFLNKARPEIQNLVNEITPLKKVNSRTSGSKKTVVADYQSWLRIRPTRRRSYKYSTGESDSDPDYAPDSSPEEKVRAPYREPLENIERRLGIPKKPNQYGSIEGVVIGQWWKTRMECSYSGAHRPTVAGIHPGPEGAYSVALSGGYEGDWDVGDEFTFTGEGGRDLKGTKDKPKNLRTAPQSKDQTLTKGNLALQKSFENQKPVRVIRGYKVHGGFAPPDGYRYDGLYRVTKVWTSVGQAGFLIYKFHFARIEDQLPLVDSMDSILLFSSIKKISIPKRSGLRRKSSSSRGNVSYRQSGNENSEAESESDGLKSSPKKSDADDGEEEQTTYIEIDESLPTFYKGRFLGFEDPSEDNRNAFEALEELVELVERDYISLRLSSDDESSVDEKENSDDELSLFLEDTPKISRRKNEPPRKVIRS